MDDRDLFNLISDIQLKCGKGHSVSDLILHTLEQLRNGDISEDYCRDLILTLLRPYPELLERFSIMIEDSPPPCSRTGCVGEDEPFINTIIEFELWHGALNNFLRACRRVLLHQNTLDDVFVQLENINPNSSGPFWLLWELYKPILVNCSFMQGIYDGCIAESTIPIGLEAPLTPSQSDQDPASAIPETIFDSDLFCCHLSDCRNLPRPLGIIKHGSYGLLKRKDVNVRCSGRTLLDFSVLNDRWTTSASGSEGQFQPSLKNQYEERLFNMENERITLDVRICRLNNTLNKLRRLLDEIRHNRLQFDPNTFPRGVFNSLDILTMRELYDTFLNNLLTKIVENPIEMLEILIHRISDKIIILKEVRRNKESDYYDFTKKNYARSLEVRHEEKQQPQPQSHGTIENVVPYEIHFSFEFNKEAAKEASTLIQKVYKFENKSSKETSESNSKPHKGSNNSQINKEIIIDNVLEYILVVLKLGEPTPLSRHLRFSGYPTNTSIDKRGSEIIYMPSDLVLLFQLFMRISSIIEKIFVSQPSGKRSDDESSDDRVHNDENQEQFADNQRGISLAYAIGNMSLETTPQSNFTQEVILESLLNYVLTGKVCPALDVLNEMPTTLPQNTIDVFKRCIQMFIKSSLSIYSDDLNQLYIDAIKCQDEKMYRAICLEKLSGQVYYMAKLQIDEENESLSINDSKLKRVLEFETQIPRHICTSNSVKLFFHPDIGVAVLDETLHDEQQNKIMTGRYSTTAKIAKRSTYARKGYSDMKFRLSSDHFEFSPSPQTLVMFRK